MVPANKGAFEAAIAKGNHEKNQIQGQTRQHAHLCHLLGIKQVIVCINKMDDKSVNYSKDRYDEIKKEMDKLLTKCGYKTKKIPFIPMSAWNGDNVVHASSNMPWYKGFNVKIQSKEIQGITLLDALEKVIKPPKKANNKPFIMPISGVYKIKGVGDAVTGRIEQGTISHAANVKFCISGATAKIHSIEMHRKTVELAQSGDNVGILFKFGALPKENRPKCGDLMVIDQIQQKMSLLVAGFLRQHFLGCYEYLDPTIFIINIMGLLGDIVSLKVAKQFTALVYVQDHPGKFLCAKEDKEMKSNEVLYEGGFRPMIYVRTAKAQCQMIGIKWKMGKSTKNGKVEDAEYIEAGDTAAVIFKTLKKPLIVQPFEDCKGLGRIAAMDSNLMIMLGEVVSVEYMD